MHNTLMVFDFGANEDAAQQARHKLDVWKQAYRLDKKLLFKFQREEEGAGAGAAGDAEKSETAKLKGKEKAASSKKTTKAEAAASNGTVKLIVRLYFSGHEKLSYQRWADRIPAEELFKAASPKVIRYGETGFEELLKQFDSLE